MALTLSERDRVRIRSYLGYPNTTAQFVLQKGTIGSGIESNYLLDLAFNHLREEAVEEIQKCLRTIDTIEEILGGGALDRLAAAKLGELQLRTGREGESEPDLLRKEREFWVKRISDLLNVAPYQSGNVLAGGKGVIARHHA